MPVLFRNLQHSVPINTGPLKRMAHAILSAAHIENAELSLLLVTDRRMRALNVQYRKKDRPTDVLAFSQREERGRRASRPSPQRGNAPFLLGDVVISMPTAQRQAAEFGHSVYTEVIRLLVHGVLHLLGYDHERSPREAVRMARRERAILKILQEKCLK